MRHWMYEGRIRRGKKDIERKKYMKKDGSFV